MLPCLLVLLLTIIKMVATTILQFKFVERCLDSLVGTTHSTTHLTNRAHQKNLLEEPCAFLMNKRSALCQMFYSSQFNTNAMRWMLNVFVDIQHPLHVLDSAGPEMRSHAGRSACTNAWKWSMPWWGRNLRTDDPSLAWHSCITVRFTWSVLEVFVSKCWHFCHLRCCAL